MIGGEGVFPNSAGGSMGSPSPTMFAPGANIIGGQGMGVIGGDYAQVLAYACMNTVNTRFIQSTSVKSL